MLPIWVYRMRVLGYPPVWMSEAEVKKPLNIFDDDHVQDPPGDCKKSTSVEDGEVDAGDSATKYNKEAFHQYPGFNCPAPPNVKDVSWEKLNFVFQISYQFYLGLVASWNASDD